MEIILLVVGCAIGAVSSYLASRHFHMKAKAMQGSTDDAISDIRRLVHSIQSRVTEDVFRSVAIPILRSVHGYVSSMSGLAGEIRRQKKAGSNRKVEMLIGEVELLLESLESTLGDTSAGDGRSRPT